jgi:hypothetical protein
VTQGQSGQVHDDRSLSVPQLDATATADHFENNWGSDIFTEETSHCRDSVMGCFIRRRGMVIRLPTRFHQMVIALRVRVISPSRIAA